VRHDDPLLPRRERRGSLEDLGALECGLVAIISSVPHGRQRGDVRGVTVAGGFGAPPDGDPRRRRRLFDAGGTFLGPAPRSRRRSRGGRHEALAVRRSIATQTVNLWPNRRLGVGQATADTGVTMFDGDLADRFPGANILNQQVRRLDQLERGAVSQTSDEVSPK
jgi:hypothetical protein